MDNKFFVGYDEGKFWVICPDDDNGDYEVLVNFNELQRMAEPFKWSMQVKKPGQRKFHAQSIMTESIYAMLDTVKDVFKNDCNAIVICQTPDVTVEFHCA